MPTTTNGNQTGFDVPTYKKFEALFDSPNPGESETAFRKTLLMFAKCGVRFSDAMAVVHGQDDERIAKLEAENAELRRGGDELADALAERDEKIAALEARGPNEGRVWSPKVLLMALAAVIAARIGLFMGMGERPPADLSPFEVHQGFAPWIANIVFVLSGSWLLAQWHRAQYRADGWGQLVLKWAVLGSGLLLVTLIFFRGAPWDAYLAYSSPAPALVVAIVVVILVLSKFTERLAEKAAAQTAAFSARRFVSWIVGWFV
jgi:hypothetical protein